MNLTLIRQPTTDEGTFGDLVELKLKTLELPWRDNDSSFSCIPCGAYVAAPYMSPTKGAVYLLQGVEGRSMIEIHSANFGGDVNKGWQSQLLGCIALGLSQAQLENMYDRLQQAVLNSRSALSQFLAATKGQPILLSIQNATGGMK
jgi:uncharacterized protein DUF5675